MLYSLTIVLSYLIGSEQERPRWKNRSFPWTLWFSDGRRAQNVRIAGPLQDSVVGLDFQFLARQDDREAKVWVPRSSEKQFVDRIVWVAGEPSALEADARELAQSLRILERYTPR